MIHGLDCSCGRRGDGRSDCVLCAVDDAVQSHHPAVIAGKKPTRTRQNISVEDSNQNIIASSNSLAYLLIARSSTFESSI